MKFVYLVLPVISLFMSITMKTNQIYELFGLWIATAYLTWNIYAYLNAKKMFPPMNYGIDFSALGDKTARTFLVGLSGVLYLLIIAIWMSRETV